MNEPEAIARMIQGRTIAVVGLSDDPAKPSHYVSAYMQRNGARIIPVNPGLSEVLGERCFPSLTSLPDKPEVVNVFRLPKAIPAIVEEMMALNLNQLWVQSGIVNLEAAKLAEKNGIHVVMDRCLMVQHRMGVA